MIELNMQHQDVVSILDNNQIAVNMLTTCEKNFKIVSASAKVHAHWKGAKLKYT